ncbi:MAG: TraR/DksA family transcriptional regulator [Pseudomonadota bacterium]
MRQTMTFSQSQLSKIRKSLEKNHKSLLEEVRDALEKTENQQYVELINRGSADTGDAAIGDLLADINLAIIDRHIKEIRDIEAAMARIAGGSYGSCIDCGETIGFERLLAFPTAKRCIVCQRQREKIYAHAGTPNL